MKHKIGDAFIYKNYGVEMKHKIGLVIIIGINESFKEYTTFWFADMIKRRGFSDDHFDVFKDYFLPLPSDK